MDDGASCKTDRRLWIDGGGDAAFQTKEPLIQAFQGINKWLTTNKTVAEQ